MFKEGQFQTSPPLSTPFLPKENKGPHMKIRPPAYGPHKEQKGPPHRDKGPHNVKKNPLGKRFPERSERLLLPPPPERPCMALLQYYNNAREISSSPHTPHPHNEIVIFYNNVERLNTQYPSLGSHRKLFEAKFS